ncbi:MAG: Do family serine endopeptidase [Pseudomonadota bacterium]|nr:MAG: Do family serine endopeptidase [Pseudomonadota bacterium]
MRIPKTVASLFQIITIGLAAAFVVLYFFPDAGEDEKSQPVVELRETQAPTSAPPVAGPASYAATVEAAAPAVVNIYTRKVVTERAHPLLQDPFFRHFFGDELGAPRQRLESSLGSGVIVSAQGYIITNNHVIEGADEIQIALRDGRSAQASIVGTDPESDLAVLRVELDKLPAITLGHSNQVRVGDVVLAIGNPFGVGQTVTSGIVSATGRDTLGLSTFENFIQTDAAINPGNSGGALVNVQGHLVGVNTAIFSRSGGSQGIGFAIPVSIAKDVMQQIIEHGKVIRGWLGVAIQELTDELAESFGLKSADGVLVSNVFRGGPADTAGIAPGDVITHINDTVVNDVGDALNLISQAKPGDQIRVEGVRRGEPFTKDATVAQRPQVQKE